jgi:hypothetical protein
VSAFARAKEWGGEKWAQCIGGIIALDHAWDFPDKGKKSMPTGEERPGEIEAWMKSGRKWGSTVDLKNVVGSRSVSGSFAAQWWGWWGEAQPPERIDEDGAWKGVDELEEQQWTRLALMHGRNGFLMYAVSLLWWAEAARKEDGNAKELPADWLLAVEDLTEVLGVVLKRVDR